MGKRHGSYLFGSYIVRIKERGKRADLESFVNSVLIIITVTNKAMDGSQYILTQLIVTITNICKVV